MQQQERDQRQQTSELPGNTHYCRGCKKQRPVTIDSPTQENWHEQDVSVVRCSACQDQLGHLTWWPARDDDDFTGI